MKTLRGKPFLQGIAHNLKDYSEPFRASYSPDSNTEDDLRVEFEDAMDEMPEPGEQKFILVDGLDECLDVKFNSGCSVVSVLKKLRQKLPNWLTIIATARRDDRINKELATLNANFVIDKDLTGWNQNKEDQLQWEWNKARLHPKHRHHDR